MAEEERNRIRNELKRQEDEMAKAQLEHDTIKNKLAALEKKIIVGGENLLEKAEEQEKLLEESAKELEETIRKEAELKKALQVQKYHKYHIVQFHGFFIFQEKEAERLDVEEKYSSLQEEAAGKTRKLKKVWTMLQSAKSELSDLQVKKL